MSRDRDRGRVHFKMTLDPGLLLAPQDAEKAVSRGKGKSRAVEDGLGNSNNNNSSRSRARKPISRVNSLILSTDSPNYVRERQLQLAGPSVAQASTFFSAIGSFGSNSNSSIASLKDINVPQAVGVKETSNQKGHTKYSNKRKKLEDNTSEPVNDDVFLPLQSMLEMPIEMPMSGSDTANEVWDNIWGRWNSQSNTSCSHNSCNISSQGGQIVLTDVQEVIEETEKHPSSSQHSHLSIQSEDGQFSTTWSIHEQLHPTSGLGVIEEHLQTDKSTLSIEDSRSGMEEGLLLESTDEEDQEEDEQVNQRLEQLCNKSTKHMQKVGYIIFQGNAVLEHFSPAWDGFQLKKPPPSRLDVAEWGADKTPEGQLYDYEDMEQVPQWHDEADFLL